MAITVSVSGSPFELYDGEYFGETVDEHLTDQQVQMLEDLHSPYEKKNLAHWARKFNKAGTGQVREAFGIDDFGAVFGDVLNKNLQTGFETPETNWDMLVRSRTVNEFDKSVKAYFLGSMGTFPEVLPGDEMPTDPTLFSTSGPLEYKISKRALEMPLTMESLNDDDLGIFEQRAEMFGRSAVRTLEEFVFQTILDGPSGNGQESDQFPGASGTTALFNNTVWGNDTNANLTPDGLETAMQVMETQTDIDDNEIVVEPAFLVVHPSDRLTAENLLQSDLVVGGEDPSVPSRNKVVGQNLTVISTPFVPDNGEWYLIADPMQANVIEMGFFQGREEPVLVAEPENAGESFTRFIRRFAAWMAFGGTALDPRSFVRGGVTANT